MKNTLILLRHGQSLFNKKNIFTGWVDVPLSKEGIQEAIEAGNQIAHLAVDEIYTSTLIRAQMTAFLAMSNHSSGKVSVLIHPADTKEGKWGKYASYLEKDVIPVYADFRLNERMYGDLQGFNKEAMREKYGKEQVHIWRRSFDVRPPEGESLEDNAKRTLPYFEQQIVESLKKGKNVLVSAHGNSLRAIIMHIEKMSAKEVIGLEIPTGKPLIYSFEEGDFAKRPSS